MCNHPRGPPNFLNYTDFYESGSPGTIRGPFTFYRNNINNLFSQGPFITNLIPHTCFWTPDLQLPKFKIGVGT